MKRLLAIFLVLGTCLTAGAQDIDGLLEAVRSKRISFNYSYTIEGKVPVIYKGNVLMQQGCYYATGGGLRIWCDSLSRWTSDETNRELYIETAGESTDFFANAEYYLEGVYDLQFGKDSFKGKYADPQTGVQADFVISDILFFPPVEDITPFVFDESSLDSSWVVTDLR